jgi:hypothetical protein
VKIAWPSPRLIVARHIEQVFLDDLLKLLDSFDQREDTGDTDGGTKEAPEKLSDEAGKSSFLIGA